MPQFRNTFIEMQEEELETKFKEAYHKASTTGQKFPPDIMLLFYAYYKQATEVSGIYSPAGDLDVRNAFKLNALLQVKGLSVKQAKLKYIQLVDQYITD